MQGIDLLWLNVAITRQKFWFFLKPYTAIKKKKKCMRFGNIIMVHAILHTHSSYPDNRQDTSAGLALEQMAM